jgi:hypothetical protein
MVDGKKGDVPLPVDIYPEKKWTQLIPMSANLIGRQRWNGWEDGVHAAPSPCHQPTFLPKFQLNPATRSPLESPAPANFFQSCI